MNKSTNYLALAVGILAVAAVAACGTVAFQNYQSKTAEQSDNTISVDNTPDNPNIETEIKSNGISIRKLNTTTSNGQITHTFSYTITPDTATDKTVSASLAWNDSNVQDDIDDYLTVSVDTDAMTISVTALQNFANKATLTVTSNSNLLQYATVSLECLKKFNGWNSNGANSYGNSVGGIALQMSDYANSTYTNRTVDYNNLPGTLTDFTLAAANTTASAYWNVSMTDYSNGFTSVYTKDVNITLGWTISQILLNSSTWKFCMYGYHVDSDTHYETAYDETSSYSSLIGSTSVNMGTCANVTSSALNVSTVRSTIQTAIESLPNATRLSLFNHYSTYTPGNSNTTLLFGVKTTACLHFEASTGETMDKTVTLALIDHASRFSFKVPVTSVAVEVESLDF